MLRLKNKRGQSTLEYAIIFVAILVAFLFIQTYVRRAVQGRLRSASDDVGDQYSVIGTMNYNVTRNTDTREAVTNTGRTTTEFLRDVSGKTGNEQTANMQVEPWTY